MPVFLFSRLSVLSETNNFFFVSSTSRGMECASDVSIQRRRICCTVIWIGDAQSTYLLIDHFISGRGNRLSQEPACQLFYLISNLMSGHDFIQTGTIARFFQQEPSLDSFHRKSLFGYRNLPYIFSTGFFHNQSELRVTLAQSGS